MMQPRRYAGYAFAALFAGAFILFARAPATNVESAAAEKPEVVAATFASAWCSSCKVLKPKLARVIPGFAKEPVSFIEFDFTFGAKDETRAEAEKYGIAELYDRNKGATGFTVLVDYDTGEILDTLTMNFSEAAMKAAIARAIDIASHTEQEPAAAASPVE